MSFIMLKRRSNSISEPWIPFDLGYLPYTLARSQSQGPRKVENMMRMLWLVKWSRHW